MTMSSIVKRSEERRLFPRLRFRNPALLVSPAVVGKIVDVSLGGLCCRYYGRDGGFVAGQPFDIVTSEGIFAIYPEDYAVVEAGAAAAGLVTCRLRFTHVSATQLAGLWAMVRRDCRDAQAADGGRLPDFPSLEACVAAGRRWAGTLGAAVPSALKPPCFAGRRAGMSQKGDKAVALAS